MRGKCVARAVGKRSDSSGRRKLSGPSCGKSRLGDTFALRVDARRDIAWRVAFVAGLIAAPAVCRLFSALPPLRIDAGWGAVLLAGFLVGLGTRYGAGCTSGHGVCGLSRLSFRSLVATVTFMATGFLTVFLIRHLWQAEASMKTITSLLSGLVFGFGLLISGMADPAKVLGFLDLAGAWDPSLELVMLGAIAVGMVPFYIAGRSRASLLGEPVRLPSNRQIDRRLVVGACRVLPRPGAGRARHG